MTKFIETSTITVEDVTSFVTPENTVAVAFDDKMPVKKYNIGGHGINHVYMVDISTGKYVSVYYGTDVEKAVEIYNQI